MKRLFSCMRCKRAYWRELQPSKREKCPHCKLAVGWEELKTLFSIMEAGKPAVVSKKRRTG